MDGPRPIRPIQIPFLADHDTIRGDIIVALRGSRFELVTARSWTELHTMAPHGSVCVIGLSDLIAGGHGIELKAFSIRRPDLHFILAHRHGASRSSTHSVTMPSRVTIVPLSAGVQRLLAKTAQVWLDAWAEKAGRRVLYRRQLPMVLRTFVRALLITRIGSRGTPHDTPFVSIGHVCSAAGLSRSQVFSQARARGTRLSSLIDGWRAVQVLAMRDLEGLSCGEVEWLMGYESRSGLSDLLFRALGYRPSALPTYDIESWLSWYEEECIGQLLCPPAYESGDGRRAGESAVNAGRKCRKAAGENVPPGRG